LRGKYPENRFPPRFPEKRRPGILSPRGHQRDSLRKRPNVRAASRRGHDRHHGLPARRQSERSAPREGTAKTPRRSPRLRHGLLLPPRPSHPDSDQLRRAGEKIRAAGVRRKTPPGQASKSRKIGIFLYLSPTPRRRQVTVQRMTPPMRPER